MFLHGEKKNKSTQFFENTTLKGAAWTGHFSFLISLVWHYMYQFPNPSQK